MDIETMEEDVDGSIHSIHVRNFFCHDNLEVKLNRNVNFIVGRNGSGKSAILTALVIGLGGRASATNRGTNLHSFIKKGTNSATIEIKIRNSNPKAYKHSVYGDYITIVRNINASGGSSYKVKTATGEIISTKFEEVSSIILAHDIQVDNPISVLNQDDARSFHASDAKKKYSLFRKATNLDQTEANYTWALDSCNKATAVWQRKKEVCIELEKEYKKWKASYEHLQSRDEIELKKQSLQNEYYWSEIVELEREAVKIQTHYDRQNAKIEKMVVMLSNMEENFGSNNETIESLKQQLEDNTQKKTALEKELCDLQSELRAVQTSARAAQQAAAKRQELADRERRKVADLEREIRNIESGDTASMRAELEQHAEQAAAAATAAHARYGTAHNDAAQARAAAAHAQAQHDRAADTAHAHRNEIKRMKQELRELESRSNESLAVYGKNMVELCHRVKQAVARGQFSAPPRGPIGAYLKVKEKRWGGALEHILGSSVHAFCVNTPEDARKLFEIMGEVYGGAAKPSVTCSKFLSKQHDVRRNRVRASSFSCALDALITTDPVVVNYLIDNLSLEAVLLVPEHEDAIRLSDTVENVPEKCSKIVTLDSTEYYPAPNYRSYGGVARPSRYLHLSTAERKRQVQAEIEEAETQLRALDATATQMGSEADRARQLEREAARALQALLAERHRRDEDARRAADARDQHHAPHHAVLVEELNVTKEKLKSLSEQVQLTAEQERQYEEKLQQYDADVQRVQRAFASIAPACRSLSEEIAQEQLRMDRGVSERQTLQQKLNQDKAKQAEIKPLLQEKLELIKTKTEEALMLCPRVENPRDKAIVSNELKKTQLQLRTIRDDGMSKAQVAERLLQVERKYRRTQQTLQRLKRLIDEVKITTDKHLKYCHQMQSCIARRVQHCFHSILTVRGYSGSMHIDNAQGTLEIRCTGRENNGKRVASSTSSLSGGERSYSTVAFIMALWECVELPFYFMDEFDVFMDNVNRKIVMDLLIDHALKNTSRQFVFLTPQDTSTVVASPQISIHLMADPRP